MEKLDLTKEVLPHYDNKTGATPATELTVSPTWRPGVENHCNQHDSWSEAGGDGEVVYSVIATFKPGKYPARVFYLRNWIDPDGKCFGKNNLRITTTQHFREMLKGWRHEYDIDELEQK